MILKSMNNKLLISIFTTIIIMLVAISTYNFSLNRKLIKDISNHKAKIESDRQVTSFIETETVQLFEKSLLSSGLILKDIYVTNEQGVKVRLNTLFNKRIPKLVLRYSEINCMTCVDSCLVYIDKYKSIIGIENIIILASYHRQQDVNIFKRISKVRFEVYNTNKSRIGLPAEKSNSPFLFVSDQTLVAQSVFFPEKTLPKLTEMYFQTIIHRYFH